MDHSLPGSSVAGSLQGGIPEWVAISFSRSFQPSDRTRVSRIAGRRFSFILLLHSPLLLIGTQMLLILVWALVLFCFVVVAVVQSPSRVQLFATPWTAAHQASLSLTISLSLLKLVSIEWVMSSTMYGCESWTVKKAEHWRIDAFGLWCWRRLLRVPWTAGRSNQSILKEISPGCSLEGLVLNNGKTRTTFETERTGNAVG